MLQAVNTVKVFNALNSISDMLKVLSPTSRWPHDGNWSVVLADLGFVTGSNDHHHNLCPKVFDDELWDAIERGGKEGRRVHPERSVCLPPAQPSQLQIRCAQRTLNTMPGADIDR